MSLINQMLKDLERRSNPNKNMAGTMYEVQTSLKKLKNNNHLYAIILLIILFIVVNVFILQYGNLMNNKRLSHTVKSLQVPSFVNATLPLTLPTTNPALDLHTTASVITGLTVQTQKEKTVLRILLSQNTFYRVSINSKRQYVIVFEHAQLVSTLPSINTFNSAIQDIRMMNHADGNLYLFLTLKKGTELNNLELNTEGKYPEFQMDMTYKENDQNTQISQENIPLFESLGKLSKSIVMMGPDEEYQQALQYAYQGNTKKAITILTELIEKFPNNTSVRESLVKILLDEGKNSEAKNIIQVGLKLHPFYAPYAELKARILVKEGQIDDAINLLQNSAPSINKNPEYHAFIAALYQRKGQSLLAAKLYEQLLPLEPQNPVWWMGLGIAYENLGKHNEAMQAYLRADNSDKLNPELKAYIESRMHSLQ